MLAVAYSEGELRHLWVCNSWPSGDDGDGDGDNDDADVDSILTAQVTYPDFSYDCEALAVDPVTRCSIASNNVAKTLGLVLKYLLWAPLPPNP